MIKCQTVGSLAWHTELLDPLLLYLLPLDLLPTKVSERGKGVNLLRVNLNEI